MLHWGLPSSSLLCCILTVYPTLSCHQQHSTSEHIGWCQLSPTKPQTGRDSSFTSHNWHGTAQRWSRSAAEHLSTGVQLPHSSTDTWIVSVEDDWIQPDVPRVEMFLYICNSPALIAQDFCTHPSPLPPACPHLDVFVGGRFLVILLVFLKLSQFLLCLQFFKPYCSFMKS